MERLISFIRIFFKILYSIIFRKRFELFNEKYIKIPYHYLDNDYYYLFKRRRNFTPINIIKDENGKDITEFLLPYLGPNYDFLGVSLTPSDFGYSKIIIENIRGDEFKFENNEIISI